MDGEADGYLAATQPCGQPDVSAVGVDADERQHALVAIGEGPRGITLRTQPLTSGQCRDDPAYDAREQTQTHKST